MSTQVHASVDEATVRQISEELDEPDWLLETRLEALEALEDLDFPDVIQTPGRKWTDLEGLDYEALVDPLSAAEQKDQLGPDDIEVLPFAEAIVEHGDLLEEQFGSVVDPQTNYLTALSTALFTTGTVVYVPEGVEAEDVTIRTDMNSRSLFNYTLVVAEESSSVTILERQETGDELDGEARSASGQSSSAEQSRSRDGDAVSRDDEDGQRPSSNHSADRSSGRSPREDGDEPGGPTAARVIRDCVQLSKALAVLVEPVLPGKAEALWSQLGEAGSVHETALEDALAAPPESFGEPDELFDQLEDDEVERLNEQLEARIEAAGSGTESDESEADDGGDMDLQPVADERVSFDEFQELDLRVGEVLSAEPIEGADKLAKLRVDIGVETRQLVAGIRQLHDLEELPGTRIVVVANLEKSELFGVESNGMLLAAGDQADLLTTLEDAEPGTRVQ